MEGELSSLQEEMKLCVHVYTHERRGKKTDLVADKHTANH